MTHEAKKPAGFWRLATLTLVLAFLGGTVALLASGGRGPAAPRELLDPAFELGTLPFGLEPVSAVRLPFGVQLVRLRRPGAAEIVAERPPSPPPEQETAAAKTEEKTADQERADKPADPSTPAAASSDGAPKMPRTQWKKLAIAPAGEPPQEAALLGFGDDDDGVRAWLMDGGARQISELGDEGGQIAVDVGKFPWDVFDARYVHRRKFGFTSMTEAFAAGAAAGRAGASPREPMRAPAQYSDDVRIDLSANGRAWGLTVIWPRGVTGSKEQAIELARALKPKPREEHGAKSAPH